MKIHLQLGNYTAAYRETLNALKNQRVMQRIWNHDHTVWQDDPTEITNRLGWLTIMDRMQDNIAHMLQLRNKLESEGYTNVLLLGMGGSSLAPEVFSYAFDESYGIDVDILDSTDPAMVTGYDEVLNLEKTLFIVATKSGGTAETLSAFKYFYNRVLAHYDGDQGKAGQHFVGITDPGSKLEDLSQRYQFRDLFLNDPNIGGRYSVLSYFGLVPATLLGVDIPELLERAQAMAKESQLDDSGALHLGAVLGALAKQGRDKLTIFNSLILANFGDWVEQLIAESTGKNGTGILPVVGEAIGTPANYGDDRLFVYIRVGEDETYDAPIQALVNAGQPVVTIDIGGKYDLGGQFFLWEMATAVAGHILGIHPFNQPNVESAKQSARAKIDEYMKTGQLESLPVAVQGDGIQVMGDTTASSPKGAMKNFLAQGTNGSYVSVHAYIPMTEASKAILTDLQTKIRNTTKMATTIGFGPRFLHSTGQLHKGDAGNGLFIQFTADMPNDVDIPDEAGSDESGMTFGTLKSAQALGDRAALLDVNRKVIRFHLSDVDNNLKALIDSL
ncbi:MAG: glucose-6-phosphate isomerase [Chloroflexota bacterium]